MGVRYYHHNSVPSSIIPRIPYSHHVVSSDKIANCLSLARDVSQLADRTQQITNKVASVASDALFGGMKQARTAVTTHNGKPVAASYHVVLCLMSYHVSYHVVSASARIHAALVRGKRHTTASSLASQHLRHHPRLHRTSLTPSSLHQHTLPARVLSHAYRPP